MSVLLPKRTNLSDWFPVPCTCALCPVPYMADTIQSRSHFDSFSYCAFLSSSSLADAMTSAAGNNLATTSASQPSASSCSGGARGSDAGDRQPAINRSNLSPIVTEVLEFGRIPKQIKRPRTKDEREDVVCKVLESSQSHAFFVTYVNETAFDSCMNKLKNIRKLTQEIIDQHLSSLYVHNQY